MELIIDILVIAGIILFSLNASKKKKTQPKNLTKPNQPRPEGYTRPAKSGGDIYHKAQQAATDWKKSLYEADRDKHYDRASLDYCDSDVPSSAGISFRNLPPGTDELAFLARWNHGREKMLERSLESRE